MAYIKVFQNNQKLAASAEHAANKTSGIQSILIETNQMPVFSPVTAPPRYQGKGDGPSWFLVITNFHSLVE